MDNNERSVQFSAPSGTVLAPIHRYGQESPLRICVLVNLEPDPATGAFVLLRELPGSRVYLGAVCDADARIQEWVEVWVQTLELRDLGHPGQHLESPGYQERLTNHAFDQRWRSEYEMHKSSLPETVLVTGMEEKNPGPILIKRRPDPVASAFAAVDPTPWRTCKDDALLESFGLSRYSTSPYRYLYDPDATGAKTFLSPDPEAPTNSHVQNIERLKDAPEVHAVFNPHAGLIRVTRFTPLSLEDSVQILEGRTWNRVEPSGTRFFHKSIYAELQAWSSNPKGIPFLLHGAGTATERLNEIFFLKLALLRDMFKEVRAYVKAQQLPLLNVSPASFRVSLPDAGDHFPVLWAGKCALTKPGQAYPLKIKSTEQRYFIRLGQIEPSPFLPENLGAHSFGIGSVRIRNVIPETDGLVLDGTLVAEDYLRLDAQDLLWFKLPLANERIEFYAHVYTSETVGPRETRFRTVPAKLAESVVASLKRVAGTSFPRSPYEIWPLLSSPCDMFSLGVMAVRVLLANSQSNLPVILDEVLSLARHLGKDAKEEDNILPRLKALLERDHNLLDLVSPSLLIESNDSPEHARSKIRTELWLEAIVLLLRLFPGVGSHSYCKSFGDVSPLALETVFDRPIQELETLVLRLRSTLAPSLSANEEIASVLLEHLAAV